MKKYIVKNRNGKIIGEVYFLTNYRIRPYKDRKQFIQDLIINLERTKSNYAGFSTKKDLKNVLNKFIFFQNNFEKREIIPLTSFNIKKIEILHQIKNTLIKCCSCFVPETTMEIFIFPCFSNFVKEKMAGVSGHVPQQNTIHIYLWPTAKHSQKRLKYTIAHEFYHAISDKYYKKWGNTLLNNIVSEGLANNFRIQAVGRALTPGLIVLSEKQCQAILPKIEKFFDSRDPKIFNELFFEGKKYPLWAGYSLGYQIVKSFLKKHLKMKWEEIMKLPPKEILMKSDFRF